ncbi:DUF262 domain-containing protein [Aquimonas sp.]|uniref:DUF262 domain-containing protein n=1 Tax=Aquimonas sp. TaxID=1872588 RepID=UPI0037BF2963
MERRHNIQNIAWLYDLFERRRLEMDPPYQRRSVWNQKFRDYFIETILLNYPAPAIFLHEEVGLDGRAKYFVVDGKQRLTSIFDFISGRFPVPEKSNLSGCAGLYFEGLPDDAKRIFWGYQFLVEYLPSIEEALIGDVFDRINRNVSKLTPQELRHAKLDGEFISEAERYAEYIEKKLPSNFPRLAEQSRRQMKDVELIASLFLLLENGPQSFSQADMDAAFLARDENWERKSEVLDRFEQALAFISTLLSDVANGGAVASSRLRNQVDFYSLFGAVDRVVQANMDLPFSDVAFRLLAFTQSVDDPEARGSGDLSLRQYYDAARSASSDRRSREVRIDVLFNVISGKTVA